MPSSVIRVPASAISRCLTSAGRDEAATLTRSSTAVATLLTFWPPGPEARTNRSSISPSSMKTVSVMTIASVNRLPVLRELIDQALDLALHERRAASGRREQHELLIPRHRVHDVRAGD